MARVNAVSRRIASIFVLSMLAFSVVDTTAFAQAGATGGSVGKRDKSISGDGEAPSAAYGAGKKPPTQAAKPNERTDSACERIAADIGGTWNSSSPSSVSEDIKQTGCSFVGTLTTQLFNHAISGHHSDGSNFSLTIARTNRITGCMTVMSGSMKVISAAQMQWVITRTDGKCDLPANFTENRTWTR